jgi:hypothetical protein
MRGCINVIYYVYLLCISCILYIPPVSCALFHLIITSISLCYYLYYRPPLDLFIWKNLDFTPQKGNNERIFDFNIFANFLLTI